MRVVFLGSPEFAVPSLRALAARYDVVAVVSQPDRPAGRGRRSRPPAVKDAALGLGLPVFQPPTLADPASVAIARTWVPDVVIVAAYGQILRPRFLEIPPLGCLNLHASLLPRWRGASPVQHALLAGDEVTGITLMRMDAGLDTGPILAQKEVPIRPDHTGASLTAELAEIGAAFLLESLPGYSAGFLHPTPQPTSGATYAPRLTRADSSLDPALPAATLVRRVRALQPWPGARLNWNRTPLSVLEAHAADAPPRKPGEALRFDRLPAVATVDGYLVLDRVQLPGGRPVEGAAFLGGRRDFIGSVLTAG